LRSSQLDRVELELSIKRNIAANFIGKSWTGVLSLLVTPVYLKFLGIEAYGLIGFFSSLLAISLLLDLGLSTTLNRELARLASGTDSAITARNLMRSLESIYWAAALAIGLGIAASAHRLASSWLPGNSIGVDQATRAISLMGVVISLRWAATLYSSGLMGLHKQVLANGILIAMLTLQAVSAICAMLLFGRNVLVFFSAQVFAAAVQIVVLIACLWRSMPTSETRPKFEISSVRAVWHFAAGVSGITILSVLLTQSDKVLLSRLLSLENFGYYVLAGSIAGALSLPAMAMYGALFPVLTASMSRPENSDLPKIYHASCQALSVLLIPVGCLVVMFSEELLTLYIRDSNVVAKTHVLLSIIALGNTLLGLMVLPLALQLAAGWTRLALYKNVVAAFLYVPCIVLSVRSFGAIGAAVTWASLACGYVLVEIPIMHTVLLVAEKRRWYLFDIGIPIAICVFIMGFARLAVPRHLEPRFSIPTLLAAFGLSAFACLGCFLKWGELRYKPALLAGGGAR
jgi:O-antigen/teichoic acid export membrane protein